MEYKLTLQEARLGKYEGESVTVPITVVGKDLAPYTIPHKIHWTCQFTGTKDDCAHCPINLNGGELEHTLSDGPETLKLLKCTESVQLGMLKESCGIPKCSLPDLEVLKSRNVEEILISPYIDYEDTFKVGNDTEYTLQRAFFVAGENRTLKANSSYEMKGVMTPDPWQQHVTFLFLEAEPRKRSHIDFKIEPELRNQLKIFRPEAGQSIGEKLTHIGDCLTDHVTHILGRNDLLLALDLVFHSVGSFFFQGVKIGKGWTECLVLGDTRTGKSEAAMCLVAHYGLGEIIFGENTSYAGLVGGMQQAQGKWSITWGKIPLNDGGLLIIDEASGLAIDAISQMSGIRTSGIAEITKIQTERTRARTRLIWLSNPRSGRPLRTYSYGVEAIPELIGTSEDIARFDYAISCASNEVPPELINQVRAVGEMPENPYISKLCHALILWAWSRTTEQVQFSDAAVKAALNAAIEMGKEYSTRIPLVESANHRIKIAKIAAALAARLFSTDETGELLLVEEDHILFARNLLDEFYSSPSFDYRGYSRKEIVDTETASANLENMQQYLKNSPLIANIFQRQNYIRVKNLEEQTDIDYDAAKGHISNLIKWGMIEYTPNGYRKTPAFIEILRKAE